MLSLQANRVGRLSEECVACLGPGTAVECVGSSASGLSTQKSDVDLNVIRRSSHRHFTMPRNQPTADAPICWNREGASRCFLTTFFCIPRCDLLVAVPQRIRDGDPFEGGPASDECLDALGKIASHISSVSGMAAWPILNARVPITKVKSP
jgi:hypothetical protein